MEIIKKRIADMERAEDRDVLKEYIKENGKEDLVAIILQKIRGEI